MNSAASYPLSAPNVISALWWAACFASAIITLAASRSAKPEAVVTSALADGLHPLTLTATDLSGNESKATDLGVWTIDNSAPAAPT